MALNAGIILQGQTPDIVGSMQRGQMAGQQANEFRQQNALNGFMRENGQAVMRGDQNALNALSQLGSQGFDAAQGVQQNALNMENTRLGMDQTRLGMDATRQGMAINDANQSRLGREEQRQIAENLATRNAGEIAAERDQFVSILKGASQFHAQGDEAGYNQFLGQAGMDPQQYPFSNFQAIAATLSDDILPIYDAAIQRNAPVETNYIGAGDPALGMNPEQPYNFTSGPNGMSASAIGGGGSTINNTFSPAAEGGNVTDDFYKNVDKGQADMYVGLVNEGVNAPAKLAQIDQLETLLGQSPSGAEAAFKGFLGNYGIQTDGLSTIQAADAIISQLVPAQRPPGSGTMSDADLALFKASLPRLINTPEGNQQIISAIRGIAVYQQQQGQIANAVISREMTPAEGRKALMELRNPLEVMRRDGAVEVGGGYSIREIK